MIGMTGVILSGGKSSRMGGTNKAFLEIRGERLIDRTVRIFQGIFSEVILVTNSPLEYLDQDVMIVTDILPGKGALGGIYTGLVYSSFSHCFVAACDMPFLIENFVHFMISRVGENDIVVPESVEGLQPLHAIYSKHCIPAVKRLMDQGNLKVTGFFNKSKTCRITSDVMNRFDPHARMFINVNSREDLEKVRAWG